MTLPQHLPRRLPAALAGVLCAVAGFAVADLVAAFVAPASTPLLAVGGAVVDRVPPWLKDFAVTTFGTSDKTVLLVGMAVVLAAGAAVAGVLEVRRPPTGAVLMGGVGVVGAVVAVTRPGASVAWAVPTAVGLAVAVLLLRAAGRRLRDITAAPSPQAAELTRRRFLWLAGVTVVGTVAVGAGARLLNAGTRAVTAARAALRLPAPANPAPALPAEADLDVAGLAPYVTPNPEFYRIDTALRVPQVDPDTWELRVTGLVDTPVTLTFADLLALPLVERYVTLTCVSNEVGGDLLGNARWLGYPVREVLARAGVHDDADMVLSVSADGWTAGTPVEVLTDPGRDALLAVGMNGEPLPPEHGFPVRLVVPGLYGYVSATKWVTELRLTRFADDVAYWSTRGWSERGPIKLASRIDVPASLATVTAGPVVVAGVAWAQHTGIAGVQVQVDDGDWHDADLADVVSVDTWRQWSYRWDATGARPGIHTLTVRATDVDGTLQTETPAPPPPDGATGWHRIEVRVR